MALKDFFKFREEEGGPTKPFLDHLEDLRWIVVKMALALGLAMVGGFMFRQELARIVQRPLATVDASLADKLQSLGVADSMTISFQLAFYAGFIIAFPFLLFFLAEFVLPALSKKERKVVIPAAMVGFGLFLAGVSFSYFVVLPQTLAYFFQDAKSLNWTPTWTVREYYSFVTQFTIAFGLSFELPVAVLTLVKLNILNARMLSAGRPYAFVVIFILAAIITPTQDILTLMLMGAPMYLLYEICIIIAWMMERNAFAKTEPPIDPPTGE